MAETYIGEIRMFAGNFAIFGWALCDGQLLPIAQNTALFSVIGTFYGGNGTSTFALPDLRGRAPIHQGSGTGLSPYVVGENGGVENVTLLDAEMPIHSHGVNAASAARTSSSPAGGVPAGGGYYTGASDGTEMSPAMIGQAGGNVPHTNLQPFLAVTFLIALVGSFPTRS